MALWIRSCPAFLPATTPHPFFEGHRGRRRSNVTSLRSPGTACAIQASRAPLGWEVPLLLHPWWTGGKGILGRRNSTCKGLHSALLAA